MYAPYNGTGYDIRAGYNIHVEAVKYMYTVCNAPFHAFEFNLTANECRLHAQVCGLFVS